MNGPMRQNCCFRLKRYLVPVLLMAIVLNIPKFFEAKISYNGGRYENVTKIDTTELRENPYYSIYSNARGAVLSLIPSLLLACLNYKIYSKMKSQPDILAQESMQQRRRKQENNLAILMLVISTVFIACHLLRNVLNIYEITVNVTPNYVKCLEAGRNPFKRWSFVLTSFSNLLLVFNSSTNMIFYSILNKQFRGHFTLIIKSMLSSIWCGKTISGCVSISQQEAQQQELVEVAAEPEVGRTAETLV